MIARIIAVARNLGPYAAIALLLPGGSLLALLLWLYRRHLSNSMPREEQPAPWSIDAAAPSAVAVRRREKTTEARQPSPTGVCGERWMPSARRAS